MHATGFHNWEMKEIHACSQNQTLKISVFLHVLYSDVLVSKIQSGLINKEFI